MSIQNIETTQYTESSGQKIIKKMLPGSEGMLMDLVQKNQYSNPTHSTIRELAANAEDSITEKKTAISILTGKTKVDDHFVIKEDMDSTKYSESKWDPNYYNLDYLSDEDLVLIEYHVNAETDLGFCDKLIIRDTGVGLSLRRLITTTMLGQSTKRLNKDLLGAYGFGAKVALSTDCGYYDLYSYYNGKLFAVRCFERHIEDLTPVRNSKFEENPVETYEGIEFRYTPTEEKNGVKIIINSRRFNKNKFRDAVEEQLLYFNHVRFSVFTEGVEKVVPVKARILLETDYFVISTQDTYRKPHILVTSNPQERGANMVCYGYIDFEEIEYPDTYGSIGVKCPIFAEYIDPESGKTVYKKGVTVTPSREQVRQGDAVTREYIRDIFIKNVKEEAEQYVSQTLAKTTKLIEWLHSLREMRRSRSRMYNSYYNTAVNSLADQENILRTLANIVDFQSLSIPFNKTNFYYTEDLNKMFPGIRITAVKSNSVKRVFSKSQKKYIDRVEIKRDPVESAGSLDFNEEKWYVKAPWTQHVHLRDKLLLSKHGGTFYTIEFDEANLPENLHPKAIELFKSVQLYENIAVDKSEEDLENELDMELKEAENFNNLTPAEKRKIANLVLITAFHSHGFLYWNTHKTAFWSEDTKKEMTLEEAQNLEGRVYYLFEEDIPLLRFIYTFCKSLSLTKSDREFFFYSDEIKFIKVSKEVGKQLEGSVEHITQFFNQIKNKTFHMDSLLVKWNTARILLKSFDQLKFLFNFGVISEEHHVQYKELEKYIYENYWENSENIFKAMCKGLPLKYTKFKDEFIDILDKLFELQEFRELQKSEGLVQDVLESKFENKFAIEDAKVVEYDKIKTLNSLLAFSEDIYVLLNRHEGLIRSDTPLSSKEIASIKEYINLIKNIKL